MTLHSELETMTAPQAAQRLLASELQLRTNEGTIRVRIVETEAYDESDAASHSYNGRTPRTDIMFGPAGRIYVYFTYGMHYCMNVVVGNRGYGAAVLVRAVEPITGEELLMQRRNKSGVELTNGPAKLCQAMGIDTSLNGHDLGRAPLTLVLKTPISPSQIVTTERIGISKATNLQWRFCEQGNSYVSRK